MMIRPHPLGLRSARPEGADQGRGDRPARGPDGRDQGHVRHRGRAHRRRQSGLARGAAARDQECRRRAEAARCRRHHHRQDRSATNSSTAIAGVNAHYGTPVNPRAPGRLPGGSSSGSASAAASDACDFAIGSDTGGSIRVPVVVLRALRHPHHPWPRRSRRRDAHGGFLRCRGLVRERTGHVPKSGRACCSAAHRPRRISSKLVVLDDAFAEADAEVAALLNDALAAMSAELPSPSHQRIAPDDLDVWREAFRIIQSREIWSVYGDFVERVKPKFGPGVAERFAVRRHRHRGDGGAGARHPGAGPRPHPRDCAAGHPAGAADLSVDRAARRCAERGA